MNLKKQQALKAKLDALALPFDTVTIGDTLAVYVGTGAQEVKLKEIKAAIAKGEVVVIDGVSTWREWSVIHLDDDQYIWDRHGDRIKGELKEFTRQVDGGITSKKIGTSFRTWDKAWD